MHTDPLDPTPAYEAAAVLTDFPAEAADALLALTGPGSGSPQVLVEVRQMGGATARAGRARQRLLLARRGVLPAHGRHRRASRGWRRTRRRSSRALDPWTGGHRLPNFTFAPEEYVDAYGEQTLARLRRAIRTYDPLGVMAIGRVLST